MAKAEEYHKKGYNCAESMLKAFHDVEGQKIVPVEFGSAFGGGMGIGATCGAVTGSMLILGAIMGRKSLDIPNESREYARRLLMKVKDRYGTYNCKDLKRKGVACKDIICFMEQEVAEIHRSIQIKKEKNI
ncbi:MAG: C-GCAxxG-C-C family protein [Selenomonadaceae bacterium]